MAQINLRNMKTKIFITLFITLAFFLALAGCEKGPGDYSKYLDKADAVYPGKPVSLTIKPGYNRAQISSLISPDPRVVKIRIYWNNGLDSLDANITSADLTQNKLVTIGSIPEGIHTFRAVTFDAAGHRSIVTEKTGPVYGPNYVKTITSRVFKANLTISGSPSVQWFSETDTSSALVGVRVTYPLTTGGFAQIFTLRNRDTTILVGAKAGGKFFYKTAYIPKNAIDTFYTKQDTLAY